MSCGQAHALDVNANRTQTAGGDGSPPKRGYVINVNGGVASVTVALDRVVDVDTGAFVNVVKIGDIVLFSNGVITKIVSSKPHLTLVYSRDDDRGARDA